MLFVSLRWYVDKSHNLSQCFFDLSTFFLALLCRWNPSMTLPIPWPKRWLMPRAHLPRSWKYWRAQPAIKRSELQLAQELTRELLADGLRRALDMLGEMSKKQFLDRQFGRVFEGSSETVGRTTSIRGQDSHFASFLHRLGRACWVGLTLQERLQF